MTEDDYVAASTWTPNSSYTDLVKDDIMGIKRVGEDSLYLSDKYVDFGVVYKNKNPITVLKGSGENFMSMTHIIGLSLKQLFSGKVEKEEVSGPVGVVTVINEAAKESKNVKEGIFNLFYMMALISMNLV